VYVWVCLSVCVSLWCSVHVRVINVYVCMYMYVRMGVLPMYALCVHTCICVFLEWHVVACRVYVCVCKYMCKIVRRCKCACVGMQICLLLYTCMCMLCVMPIRVFMYERCVAVRMVGFLSVSMC